MLNNARIQTHPMIIFPENTIKIFSKSSKIKFYGLPVEDKAFL